MEKNVKRRVAAGAVALVAIAGGGAAIGATQLSPKQESETVLNDAAKELGVSPGELSAALKSALDKRVDAAVAAGSLTKDQGNELKQRIESGDFPLFGALGFGPEQGGFEHHEMFGGLRAAAAYVGLSEAELRARLASGKSLADVAVAQGKSVDGLVDTLVADAKKHLDEAVAEGHLTKPQETEMLAHLEQGIRAMVNGAPPDGMPRPGFGFRHGSDQGPSFDGPPTFDGAAA